MKLMDKTKGRRALLQVTGLLSLVDIPYFLICGTALGAYRDKGFCPLEKDIDIGFLAEHFVPRAEHMALLFDSMGWDVTCLIKPFTRVWAIKLKVDGVGVDLVPQIRFKDWRFCSSARVEQSLVHPAHILEPPYETVEIFGTTHNVPNPIEEYLEREYVDWQTPKDIHAGSNPTLPATFRRFRRRRGVPNTILDNIEQQYSYYA